MRSIKLFLFLPLLVLCHNLLFSQVVYEAQHYGAPGDIYLYNRFSPLLHNDELTQSGEDVLWDLSSQSGLATHPVSVIQPGEGISQFNFLSICALSGLGFGDCTNIWNNTEQAIQLADSLQLLSFTLRDLQRYQNKVSNLLLENFIGFTVNIQGSPIQAVIVYQVPDTVLVFPFTYDDAWTSSTRLALDLNAAGEDITYTSTQTRNTRIDGWGSLQTPYDTFDHVVRLRSDILRLDTIVEQDTDVTVLIADQVEFMWFDTNYQLPVMTANGLILSNDSIVINQVEYIYDETCPAPTWSIDIGGNVFYIGDNGTVDITFSLLNPNADFYQWDFGDGQFSNDTESVVHTYFAPGTYAAVVDACMTDCLPLNSCSFQIIDFTILDTTTAVTHVDGHDLGIKLFPNPASSAVNLFIPESIGQQQLRMFDTHGRELRSAVLSSGTNVLDTQDLGSGLYTIQLNSTGDPGARMIYLRILLLNE